MTRLKALGRFGALLTLAVLLGCGARGHFKNVEDIEELDYNWFVEILLIGLEMCLGLLCAFGALLVFIPAMFIEFPTVLLGDKMFTKEEPETEEIEA